MSKHLQYLETFDFIVDYYIDRIEEKKKLRDALRAKRNYMDQEIVRLEEEIDSLDKSRANADTMRDDYERTMSHVIRNQN